MAESSSAAKKTEFLWVPGQGPSSDALERLGRHCPKPKQTMGEAWFMSAERRIYTELERPDVEELSHDELDRVFWAITSGPECFGIEDNWDEWYYFLLWYLLEKDKCICGLNIEYLVSAYLVLDDCTPRAPYAEYSQDLLQTLGRAIMSQRLWDESQDLKSRINRVAEWGEEPSCSGAVSASMSLCLQLLGEDQIPNWVQSILQIGGNHWRANLLCWFVSAHNLRFEPKLFGKTDARLFPYIGWKNDFLIRHSQAKFLKWKLDYFFENLREQLDLPRFMIWMEPLFDDQGIANQFNQWSIAERYVDYVLTGKKY